MRDEEQQRKERQAKLLSAIERKIAYKNIEFNFGCRHRAASLCSGIFLFDGTFLLPAGIRIALQFRVLLLRLLLQRVEVGAVGACFCAVSIAIRLELVEPMRGFCDTDSLLGSFFQLMCAFYADIIILAFPDFPVRRRTDSLTGRIPNGVLQLGRRAQPFCAVLCWDFRFCLFQLLDTFCCFLRRLGNLRGG